MVADPVVTLSRAARWAPLTSTYLLILLATTVVLRHVGPATATGLLAGSSTDVDHLARDPLTVLVSSAAWLPGRRWLPYAVVFLLALAPLERRLGASRAALIFLSGHVIATLLTELPVGVAVALHEVAPAAASRIDVGASYGMFAAVGASAALLPWRRGGLVVATVFAWLMWQLAADPDMTAYGHLISLAIGAAWWPFLRHDYGVGGRRDQPGERNSGYHTLVNQPIPDRSAGTQTW